MNNVLKSIVAVSILTISSGAFAQTGKDHLDAATHRYEAARSAKTTQGSIVPTTSAPKAPTVATFTLLKETHTFDDNTYTFEGNFTYTINGVAKVCNLENVGVGLTGSTVKICEEGDVYTDLYIKTSITERKVQARLYIDIKHAEWGTDRTLVKRYHDLGIIPTQEPKENLENPISDPK